MIYSNWKEINIQEKIKQGRVLCLDYGLKRTGVAISDTGWEIAASHRLWMRKLRQ